MDLDGVYSLAACSKHPGETQAKLRHGVLRSRMSYDAWQKVDYITQASPAMSAQRNTRVQDCMHPPGLQATVREELLTQLYPTHSERNEHWCLHVDNYDF